MICHSTAALQKPLSSSSNYKLSVSHKKDLTDKFFKTQIVL